MEAFADGEGPRFFGLYPALVTDVVDPDKIGRIEVKFPWLGGDGEDVRAWATLLSPYAEKDQGFQVLPSVDTQVVVGFEAGDPRRPYIVGACWNGKEELPHPAEEANNVRLWKTRSGSILEFDDTDGGVVVTLGTPDAKEDGGHKVMLAHDTMEVTIRHKSGMYVKMDASGKVEILANLSVDIQAPIVNVKAPVANFDGIINCTTVICSGGVVSPSYTPGAGNIW